MNTNSFIIGKRYITTDRCWYFNTAVKRDLAWCDDEDNGWMADIEVPPGTTLIIIANPDDRQCSVAQVGEQTLWVFDDDVDEL